MINDLSTEVVRDQENYSLADKMMRLAEENMWDDKNWQPNWVKNITNPKDFKNMTLNRINSVMKRYKGRLIGWDEMNENVHFSYFEDMLGKNVSAIFYSFASKLDPDIPLFRNEFNTIEYAKEGIGSPVNVKKMMEEIVSYLGNMKIRGIKAPLRNSPPNLTYMRSALDTLGSLGFPVWLTEVDMAKCPIQNHEHNDEEGRIIRFSPEISLLHGHYTLTVTNPSIKNLSTSFSLEVTKEMGHLQEVQLVINA